MSKFNELLSTPSDVLNPLKDQKDFCDRAERVAGDESRAFETCRQLRQKIRDLEITLAGRLEAAKHFKTDGLRAHMNIEDIRGRLNDVRKQYRDRMKAAARFLSHIDRLEGMAERDLGSIPHYRSIP